MLDCRKCHRPRAACSSCPIDAQPALLPRVTWLLTTYRRVVTYGALPQAGGLLDQEERLMRNLDLVHERVSARRRERDERENRRGGDRGGAAGMMAALRAGLGGKGRQPGPPPPSVAPWAGGSQ